MWHGANVAAETTSGMFNIKMPQHKNKSDGTTDNNDLVTELFFQKIIQPKTYIKTQPLPKII